MIRRLFYYFTTVLVAALVTPGCGKDPVEPPPPPSKASIVLTQQAVAVVPGGTEKIVVASTNKSGQADQSTVSTSDGDIAGVSINADTITVTGVAVGSATVTVRNSDGHRHNLPVTVYDPTVLDVGGMEIKFVDQFVWRWHDAGSGGTYNGGFWHPVATDGFHALGSLGLPNWAVPTDLVAVIVVKEVDQSGAVVHPVDYALVYTDAGSGASYNGSFWLPVPPSPDYVAMGLVAQTGWGKPALTDVVCVRKDLTVKGKAGPFIWNDHDTGASMYLGTWAISIPDAGLHDLAHVAPGTFVGWNSWTPPADHPAMNVLKIPLPMIVDGENEDYEPKLADYDTPPSHSPSTLNKAMLVPFTAVNDPVRFGQIHWQVTNSPFYRLNRDVYYRVLYHDHNQQSVAINQPVNATAGVEPSFGQAFHTATGVSITDSDGMRLLGTYQLVSSNTSLEFGFDSRTSITELQYEEINKTLVIPPDKAAAMWQKASRFVLKRHNGTTLETVGVPLEVGIDNEYIRSEYPR